MSRVDQGRRMAAIRPFGISLGNTTLDGVADELWGFKHVAEFGIETPKDGDLLNIVS